MHRRRAALAGCVLAAWFVVFPAVPADAAAGCPTGLTPPAAQPLTDPPWAQQRFDLDRLTGIADGTGITVAVIDSGVDPDQPQLRGRVLAGADELVSGGDGRQDCVGHGTAVASLIAAAPGAGSPSLRGVAPAARILAFRVTETGTGESSAARPGSSTGLASAIRTAVDRGARVLNISMVLDGDDPRVGQAVRYAIEHRAVVVAAAGNAHRDDGGTDPVSYPAAYPGVIGVAAIGADGLRLAQSQVGEYVRIAAPGGLVTAAALPSGLATFTGTSFAAPFVSGAAALVLQRFPEYSSAQVAARLYATADPVPDTVPSASYGYGVVNPYRAVTGAPFQPTPASPTAVPPARPADASAPPVLSYRSALLAAGAGAGFALLLILVAVVLPKGLRRRWRPGS